MALAGISSIAMAYLGEEIEGDSVGVAMGLIFAGTRLEDLPAVSFGPATVGQELWILQ